MENKEVLSKNLISEEKAGKIEEAIRNSQFAMTLAVNQNIMDIALKVTEAVEQKVHVIRGFEDSMKGAASYLKDTFNIKNTQRKSYAIVTHKFARRVEGGTEYTLIDPSVRDFGIANLEEIQKLDGFDNSSAEALKKFLTDNNITSKTTTTDIKKIRGIEDKTDKDNKENKDNKDNKDNGDKADTTSEDNVTTQLKAENDKLHVKVEDTRTLFSKLYQLALDSKVDDKKFREEAKNILKEIEKKYK